MCWQNCITESRLASSWNVHLANELKSATPFDCLECAASTTCQRGVCKLVVKIRFAGSNHGERTPFLRSFFVPFLPIVFRCSVLEVIIHLPRHEYHEFCII